MSHYDHVIDTLKLRINVYMKILSLPSTLLMACMMLSPTFVNAITLEEATYIAIENSPQVRQSLARYREGVENIRLTQSGYFPSINLSAGLGKETTYSGNDITLTRRELALSLTQPLFNGFQTKYEIERVKYETEADRWEALISVENTALEVAEAYANVLRYRELVALADLNLETHDRIYGQIKLKSDAGVGRQSDLSQITARLAKANSNRLAAINNLRDAESQYKRVVGEMPPEDMIYPVPDRDMIPESLDDAIDSALKKNPALYGADFDVKATESFQQSTKGNNFPTVDFILERTWNNNLDGQQGPSEDLLAMVRLNYNLYRGNADVQRQEVAVQQNIQASEIRRNTMRDIELTVRLAWAAFEATLEQKQHIRTHVIATKESQLAYEKQFRLGRRTLLDVLDSENELFQARQDYVNADFDELFAEFRIFNAKGELMRAFRIYRPELLGFADEFEEDAMVLAGQTALEELKAAESELPLNEPESASTLLPPSKPATAEDNLFIDAPTDGSSGW